MFSELFLWELGIIKPRTYIPVNPENWSVKTTRTFFGNDKSVIKKVEFIEFVMINHNYSIRS